jgi:hypothetical protein
MINSNIFNQCLSDASVWENRYEKLSELMNSVITPFDNVLQPDSSCLLPLAMKVAAKTIAYDLVTVGGDEFSEITEDGELIEPEYEGMALPSGKLFYMDFKQP